MENLRFEITELPPITVALVEQALGVLVVVETPARAEVVKE